MTGARRRAAKRNHVLIIGWRETIALPDLGVSSMKAKIDTGARTSALHAREVRLFDQDGAHWVEFIPAVAELKEKRLVRAPLIEHRPIKNTSGIPDERPVIGARLSIGGRSWLIEVSLADRERMEFDLILGRTAIRRRGILVDPGKSFLAGHPKLGHAAPEETG